MDLSLGDLFNGGAVVTSLYLAFQIKAQLSNHEARITNLETQRGRRPKARGARPRTRATRHL